MSSCRELKILSNNMLFFWQNIDIDGDIGVFVGWRGKEACDKNFARTVCTGDCT